MNYVNEIYNQSHKILLLKVLMEFKQTAVGLFVIFHIFLEQYIL